MTHHPPSPPYPPTRSDLNREIDAVAGQLLALGWVVRRPSPCDGQDPTCLMVSREAFSPVPETVHVLPHHQLELTHANGCVDHADDVQALHRHLNGRVASDAYPRHPQTQDQEAS